MDEEDRKTDEEAERLKSEGTVLYGGGPNLAWFMKSSAGSWLESEHRLSTVLNRLINRQK